MTVHSAQSYIKTWDIKGDNLFGQNISVQPDPDITLTPEHPVDKAFFIVGCSIDIRNTNGNYVNCTAQSRLKFENDKKPPTIKVLYDIVKQALVSVKMEIIEAITKYTTIPINFYFFLRVPQLMILKKADLFITHGGLGSLKEAILLQVPMLVYPLDLSSDQKGNAQKIEFQKLRISGSFKSDGLKEIEEKTLKLLREPIYKQNVKAFSDKCTSAKNYPTNLTTILNFINLQL